MTLVAAGLVALALVGFLAWRIGCMWLETWLIEHEEHGPTN